MPRIPFARQSYALDSLPASAQRLVNLYPEQLPAEARSPLILRSTRGLAEAATTAAEGKVRCMACIGEHMLVVTGGELWRWSQPDQRTGVPPTFLGYVDGNDAEPVTIAIGTSHAVVCCPPHAYATEIGVWTVHEITGETFPGASSVAWLDGYFVFTRPGTGELFVSALEEPGSFDALQFATAEGVPDVLLRAVADHNELWLFGPTSIEIWADVGAGDFPFQRMAGGVLGGVGCVSVESIVPLDGSLFWLGPDGVVYRTQGHQPKRISTHAQERAFVGYGTGLQRAVGLGTAHDGHQFYVLSFPDAHGGLGATWAYDAATELWHERATDVYGAGRWRGNRAAQFGQLPLIGDASSGRLFYQVKDLGTDDGLPVARIATLPPLWADTRRAVMHRLELEMETGAAGSAGSVALEWSDDGGLTWSAPRGVATGVPGDRAHRAVWNRLGMFRQRVLRFSTTGHCNLYAADATLEGRAT